MGHENGQGAQKLQGVVPVGHAVQGVPHGAVKAQARRRAEAVDGIGGPRQGPAAQGALVQPPAAVLQPGHVPSEHGPVGQQVLGEGDGLRPLQVGVPRHDGGPALPGPAAQHGLQLQNLTNDGADLPPHIQPEVQGHLVVPGPGGVKPLPGVADPGGEQGLHIHVDVLVVRGKFNLPRLHVGQDALQPLRNGPHVLLGDDALGPQHFGVNNASLNILPIEPLVKGDGGVELVHQLIRLLAEPSAPKFHVVSSQTKRSENE